MRVGLITYHAAYNYGSVLQAFATQRILFKLGADCEIINYRFNGQRDFYRLIRTKYGFKVFLSDIIQMPIFKQKIQREKKFELFFKKYYLMTKEYKEPSQIEKEDFSYDIFLSGSDQIWSKYSSELYHEDWKYIMPYLLNFTERKKVAYASSIGSMGEPDLKRIKPFLQKYSSISMRERSMSIKLSRYLGRSVECVLDPTLLHDSKDYTKFFDLKNDSGNYILFYTLRGPKIVNSQRKELIKYAQKKGYSIYAITPYCFFPDSKYYRNKNDSGVVDFLNYIKNAKLVVTDSYHGTVFSIIFNKLFFSICKNWDTDYRKLDLLKEVGLEKRIINDIVEINSHDSKEYINYESVNRRIENLREHSINYLISSLK